MKSALVLAAALLLTASAQAGQSVKRATPRAVVEDTTSTFTELFVRVTNGGTRQAFRYSADQVTADSLCKSFLHSPTAHPTKWTAESSFDSEPVIKVDSQGQFAQDQSTNYLNFLECVN